MNWSEQQRAIFEFVESGSGNAVLEAVAGSGKTTTLLEAASRIPFGETILFTSFARKIVGEIGAKASRAVPRAEARTMNSVGFAALRSVLPTRRPELDGNLPTKVLRKLRPRDLSRDGRRDWWERYAPALRLVPLAMAHGIVPPLEHMPRTREIANVNTGLLEGTVEEWRRLAVRYDALEPDEVDRIEELVVVAESVIDGVVVAALQDGVATFDLQQWGPLAFGLDLRRWDWVLVDEAQDLSPIQQWMVSEMLTPGTGRMIAVGDTCQAIYGFRGADTSSMRTLRERFDATSLGLTCSYRCPRAVAEIAQEIVPDFTVPAGAPAGAVETLGDHGVAEIRELDAVLCRNNAPIIDLAFWLLRNRIPFEIVENDAFRQSLVGILDAVAEDVDGGRDELDRVAKGLLAWRDKQITLAREKEAEALEERVSDQFKALWAILEASPADDGLDGVREMIDYLFRPGAGIQLTTVHRAKGLEWRRVGILDPFLIPSRYARQDWQLEQEDHLFYVAVTRAQERLVYLETDRRVG